MVQLNPIEHIWDVMEWQADIMNLQQHCSAKFLSNVSSNLLNLCCDIVKLYLRAKVGKSSFNKVHLINCLVSLSLCVCAAMFWCNG